MRSNSVVSFQSGERLKMGLRKHEKPKLPHQVLGNVLRLCKVGVFCILTGSTHQSHEANFDYYVGLLEDSGYKVVDKKGWNDFLTSFLLVIQELDEYVLTGEDINNAMNLFVTWREQNNNPEAFIMAYRYFLGSYPNPEIQLGPLLAGIGIIEPKIEDFFPPCDPGFCDEGADTRNFDPENPNRI